MINLNFLIEIKDFIKMLFKYQSEPIEQYYYNNGWDQFFKEYLNISSAKPVVDNHKAKLGKQNYCYSDGEGRRLFVWEFDNYRVFVNNKKGICVEVKSGLDQQQIINCWDDYKNRMK